MLKGPFTNGYAADAIVHHVVLDQGVNLIGKPFSITAPAPKTRSIGYWGISPPDRGGCVAEPGR